MAQPHPSAPTCFFCRTQRVVTSPDFLSLFSCQLIVKILREMVKQKEEKYFCSTVVFPLVTAVSVWLLGQNRHTEAACL